MQYIYQISGDPTIVDINEVIFVEQLDTALYRVDIIKKLIYQSKTNAKKATTGPMESENNFKEWKSKFINYFSTLIGVNGVPLSRMVLEKYNPDAKGDFPNYIENTISCAPLKGD